MGRQKCIILPSLQRLLVKIGENIHLARLRRNFSAEMVAERAGIARNMLRAIERGDSSVSFGAYANVLLCLGLEVVMNIAKIRFSPLASSETEKSHF